MATLDYFIGAGSSAGVLAALSPIVSRLIKHIVTQVVSVALTELREKLDRLAIDFAHETGGNSGGFRQAINELQKDVAEVKGQLKGSK